jgi:hypothetical protein
MRIVFPDRLMRKQINDYFEKVATFTGKRLWQCGDFRGQLDKIITDMPRWNFAGQMLVSEGMVLDQFGRRRADFDCAITAVAAAQFKADTKKLPEKLDDLAPKYLPAVPLDEFSGKPLLYKAADGGRVYSVGSDTKDDGGTRKDGHDQVFFIEDAPARHSEN